MKEKAAKTIRILTTAPLMGLYTISLLFLFREKQFGGIGSYLLSIFFLVVLPLLAYPLQPHLRRFKHRGREGQRDLAMLMAGVGYALGIIAALIQGENRDLLLIYLTYLISWIIIAVLNKAVKIRASGHAGGAAGPIAALVYFLGPWALLGVIALIAVYWSSLLLGRHTLGELALGTLVPVVSLLIALILV